MRPGELMLDRRTGSKGPGGTRVPVALVDVGVRPAPTLTTEGGRAQWVVRVITGSRTEGAGGQRTPVQPERRGARADRDRQRRPLATFDQSARNA